MKNLTAKWIFHFSDVGHMEAVPIVVDRVVYLGQLQIRGLPGLKRASATS